MEALTAAAVAALTVYDMAKAIDKAMRITDLTLVEKTKEPRVTAAVAAPLPVRYARLVKLEHTVFALPFAYVGALLSVDGWPGFGRWGGSRWRWSARGRWRWRLNRLVDAEIDARNPRTAGRELPAGQLSRAPGGSRSAWSRSAPTSSPS